MKSKKIASLVLTAGIVLGTSIPAMAAPNDDVMKALKDANVPQTYIIKAENYLKTNSLTESQSKAVVAQVSKAAEIAKKENVTDLTKLSSAAKEQVLDAVKAAAKEINLNVSVSKNAAGQFVVSLVDANGNDVLSATASEVTMKKTGANSYVFVIGASMIVLALGSLIFAKKATA